MLQKGNMPFDKFRRRFTFTSEKAVKLCENKKEEWKHERKSGKKIGEKNKTPVGRDKRSRKETFSVRRTGMVPLSLEDL